MLLCWKYVQFNSDQATSIFSELKRNQLKVEKYTLLLFPIA